MKFSRQFVLLVLAALLPMVALSAVLGVIALRQQQLAMEQDALSRTRIVSAMVSRELDAQISIIQAISESPLFDGTQPASLPAFKSLAARFIQRQPQWISIALTDPEGRRIVEVPEGEGLPPMVLDKESHARAVATGKPTFGQMSVGSRGRMRFVVRAPVVRRGQVRYVVSAGIEPEAFRKLLNADPFPDQWRAVILDGGGRVVARMNGATGDLGVVAGRRALEARREGSGGLYEGATLPTPASPSLRTVTAYRMLQPYNWSVHVAIPMNVYRQPVVRGAWLVGGCTLLGLLLASVFLLLLVRELRLRQREEAALEKGRRMEALGRMTGGVAHDFNNLLMIVQGGAEMLKRKSGDPERTASLADAILTAAHRGQSLTRQLLAFARRSTHEPVTFALQARADDLTSLLGRAASAAVDVSVSIPADVWPVRADPNALELALINLTVNARDAMDGVAGRLSVTASNVSLGKGRRDDLDLVGDFVAIAVRDNGTGIAPEDLGHVFEPFFTTKPTGKGTGLGLSQVYGFVNQSGGAVTVTSKPGEGATFTLYLPRSHEAPQTAQAKTGVSEPQAEGRLLVIEDDPVVADVVGQMMRSAGYEVVGTESGEAGLALVEGGETFDAVLSDVLMAGGMSGLDLAARLSELRPGLPIVLMTGYSEALSGSQAQGWTLLSKPFSLEQANAAIDRARGAAKAALRAAQ